MRKTVAIAFALGLSLAAAPAAEAKGCLKGAAIGGVAGHFLHHHAVLGAVAGCVIGHHLAVKKEQEQRDAWKAKHAQDNNWQDQHPHPSGS